MGRAGHFCEHKMYSRLTFAIGGRVRTRGCNARESLLAGSCSETQDSDALTRNLKQQHGYALGVG